MLCMFVEQSVCAVVLTAESENVWQFDPWKHMSKWPLANTEPKGTPALDI